MVMTLEEDAIRTLNWNPLRVRHRSAVGGGKRQWRASSHASSAGRGSDGGAEPQAGEWATLTRVEIRGGPKRG